jgi:NAD(P)-dependent dehydrogenase (short-subunit alcohol dehydrogenase family)
MQLRDTSAIVTGAASGLGAAAAAELAAGGAVVFGLDLPTAIEAAPAVEGLTYVVRGRHRRLVGAGRGGRGRASALRCGPW